MRRSLPIALSFRSLVWFGAIVLTLGAACRAGRDVTPQIRVDPNAAGRLNWLAQPAPRAASATGAAPACVHVAKESEELGGPNAIGRPGDLVLENDEVVFVIDRIGSSSGFAESGGNVVDAADAHVRRDELGQQFTYFGKFPRQGVYETLTSGTAADGSAWIEAKGRELYEPKLLVTTRYTLQAPDRALLLETTLQNTGDAPAVGLTLGDAIQWGGAEKIAPGKARGFKGPSSGPYVGGVGRFTSYAITSADGTIDGVSGSTWTDTTGRDSAGRREIALGPGQTASYRRILLVGERADSASLVSELTRSAGQPVGALAVRLIPGEGEGTVAPTQGAGAGPAIQGVAAGPATQEAGAVGAPGQELDVPADARLSVQTAGAGEVLTIHAAGTPPRLEALLPPGHYVLSYAGGGGRAGRAPVAVDVAAGGEAHADLVVTRPAGARVLCLDVGGAAMPCKVTFERTDGAPPPDFGPAHAAGPARNQATTSDGVVDVPLAWGSYRVTASRGPEYSIAQSDVTLAPGQTVELRLSPRKVVDTSGYLACDFHQHTMLGADAPVATRDRVISNGAEGVEVAVASEHNVVADLEPIVRELHLERALVSISGDELTSDASRHPWGHANAWPLPVDASDPRGGAPVVRDRTPREVFDELRRVAKGAFVIQVNHPRSGQNGYFDQLGFDPATGVGTDPGYDPQFDALEVWNGRNVDARAKVLGDFFALLRTSHPVTATADTDTHGIVGQEAGYPRTYVRVADDGPLDPWSAARAADVVRGVKGLRDVVLTNGPMLRVTAGGAPIGGVARGPVVDVKVHVESAPWVVVDELRLLRASSPEVSPAGMTRPIMQKPNAAGALVADASFTVRAAADDAFVVVASGHQPMAPVLGAAAGADAEITPWAMSGAIWIDADKDGKALKR
jgi:hypothetical protein